MASCLISAKKAKSNTTKVPNWLELPRDITTNILKRLDTIDIMTKAYHVCPLWWNIFKDPLIWRTIRMNILSDSANSHCVGSAYHGLDLLEIFRYAVKRSCGNLEVIDIENFGTDDLLECVAKKIIFFKSFFLHSSFNILSCDLFSEDGFFFHQSFVIFYNSNVIVPETY